MTIYIGEPFSWKPAAFEGSNGIMSVTTKETTAHGRVVYINEAERNKALAEFSVLFRQAQETVNRMTEIVDELDEESRPKIYRALDALAQLIKEKAGEAV